MTGGRRERRSLRRTGPDGDHGRAPDAGRRRARPRPLPARRNGSARAGSGRSTPPPTSACSAPSRSRSSRPARSGDRDARASARRWPPAGSTIPAIVADLRRRRGRAGALPGLRARPRPHASTSSAPRACCRDRDVLRIGLALCGALEHAHERGVVHRDVKPQNVIVPDAPRSRGRRGQAGRLRRRPPRRRRAAHAHRRRRRHARLHGARAGRRQARRRALRPLQPRARALRGARGRQPGPRRLAGRDRAPRRHRRSRRCKRSRKDLPAELCAAIDRALRPEARRARDDRGARRRARRVAAARSPTRAGRSRRTRSSAPSRRPLPRGVARGARRRCRRAGWPPPRWHWAGAAGAARARRRRPPSRCCRGSAGWSPRSR